MEDEQKRGRRYVLELWRTMQEQEGRGLTGPQKRAAVLKAMERKQERPFGSQPWHNKLEGAFVDMLVQVDRKRGRFNNKSAHTVKIPASPRKLRSAVPKNDDEQAKHYTDTMLKAMDMQENSRGLTGDQKREAVKAILNDIGDAFGAATWMKTVLDAIIELVIDVDKSKQSLTVKKPSCCQIL